MPVEIRISRRSMQTRQVVPPVLLLLLVACNVSWFGTFPSSAESLSASNEVFRPSEGLMIRGTTRGGRSAFHIDSVEASIVQGTWRSPNEGDSFTLANGSNGSWKAVSTNAQGAFEMMSRRDAEETNSPPRGSYLFWTYRSPKDEVLLLHPSGYGMLYVNGEPRPGDPYDNGTAVFPVAMKAGINEFLVASGRGRFRASLHRPTTPIGISRYDTTFPDLLEGEKNRCWGAVILINATSKPATHLQITAQADEERAETTELPEIPAMSLRKVGFQIRHSGHSSTNRVRLQLSLSRGGSHGKSGQLDQEEFQLRLRRSDQSHRETFVSEIDASVQYYAITPAKPVDAQHPATALVLSTHGASVEAQGQAEAYASKPWAHVVAPTNRRPYGFDWEDWGRMDALEVLGIAQKKYHTDPHQTYLTGHSMGGHGTWQLGVTFPDHFAAIAPSAGWISFFSYAGAPKLEATNSRLQLLQRASTPSDTLVLKSNYLHHGIYILHGDADDNVPVTEARTMKEVLGEFHRDFAYHEQPGAGHWWGNACVDWPPIFDLFTRHKIPQENQVRMVDFSTANPGISSASHWASIEAQQHPLAKSAIRVTWNPNSKAFQGNTENVLRLGLNTASLTRTGSVSVELDGQKFENLAVKSKTSKLWFEKDASGWKPALAPDPRLKGPHRYGPFKEAFQHRMVFVFGTQGTPEENAWAFRKSRLDAESFWYRGNGSVEVVADTAFDWKAPQNRDRGIVLYGNADTHALWKALLSDSPIQVRRGRIQAGRRTLEGADLACLFLRPRPDSPIASVAVVGGSGVVGMRLTDRIPYFLAGVALPDWTVLDPEALRSGPEGVRATGFFGDDWSIETGESAWK